MHSNTNTHTPQVSTLISILEGFLADESSSSTSTIATPAAAAASNSTNVRCIDF